MSTLAHDILFGLAVADALGVAVEFDHFSEIDIQIVNSNYKNELNRLTGFGSWNKPVGTFSDDSSLTFCLAEYLCKNQNDLNQLMKLFKQWLEHGYWSADGETFDVGRTTLFAIKNFEKDSNWKTSGLKTQRDNGNGSLMRIAPLLLPLLFDKSNIQDTYKYICDFSSLTHAHPISIDSCYIYLKFAEYLYLKQDPKLAFEELHEQLGPKYKDKDPFKQIFSDDFLRLDPLSFKATGYVVGSLEIALQCLLTTHSYQLAVLKAISLGGDTDTNAAITGAIAGILYGYATIPSHWLDELKRKQDIDNLAKSLSEKYS